MSPPILIGFTGPAGCGKDTAANILTDNLQWRRVSFAEPMKKALAAMLNMPQVAFDDREAKEMMMYIGDPRANIKSTPRKLMQTIGTEWGRNCVGSQIWIALAMKQITAHMATNHSVVVTDVRFDNEAEMIRNMGGFVIALRGRQTDCDVGHNCIHISEAGIAEYLIDARIDNTGTIDNLHESVALTILHLRAAMRKKVEESASALISMNTC